MLSTLIPKYHHTIYMYVCRHIRAAHKDPHSDRHHQHHFMTWFRWSGILQIHQSRKVPQNANPTETTNIPAATLSENCFGLRVTDTLCCCFLLLAYTVCDSLKIPRKRQKCFGNVIFNSNIEKVLMVY